MCEFYSATCICFQHTLLPMQIVFKHNRFLDIVFSILFWTLYLRRNVSSYVSLKTSICLWSLFFQFLKKNNKKIHAQTKFLYRYKYFRLHCPIRFFHKKDFFMLKLMWRKKKKIKNKVSPSSFTWQLIYFPTKDIFQRYLNVQ